MSPLIILSVLLGYFAVLVVISYFSNKDSSEDSFYTGDRKSPWYVVSFGMIGASLSGVTFLSIPGTVATNSFSYMQMVLGYVFGYVLIAYILLPLYYKYNLVSIYAYLGKRFNAEVQQLGAAFFLLSRLVGASLRLFLVALVLDKAIFGFYHVPFWLTVLITILLIWSYTFKGGIKTVVWTDTFQTFFMLASVVITIGYLLVTLKTPDTNYLDALWTSGYTVAFFESGDHSFFVFFLTGVFITVVMTGLDQDMMQKNLTVRTLKEAQKNMLLLSFNLVVVNFVFLCAGALLYVFADRFNILLPDTSDLVFAELALHHMPYIVSIPFVLGTIAAAYSSADSALTSLTTSFVHDFLIVKGLKVGKNRRLLVHATFSLVLFLLILLARQFVSGSVIWDLFQMAGLTYGPLLGLFLVGMFTSLQPKRTFIKGVCLASFLIALTLYLKSDMWFGVQLKTSIAFISTTLTVVGLVVTSERSRT